MDIHSHPDGYNVGWFRAGEYLRYTVSLISDGTRHTNQCLRFSAAIALTVDVFPVGTMYGYVVTTRLLDRSLERSTNIVKWLQSIV